jgi:hypothetical protein
MKKCLFCDKSVIGRNLCRYHYYQAKRDGTINNYPTKSSSTSVSDRMQSKYQILPNGCWMWLGNKNSAGYPMIWLNGKSVRAHRVMFSINNGGLSDDLVVCHTCDNPSCVNPDHLFSGSRDDNNKDCKNKKRNAFGMKNGHAKISAEQIKEIRLDSRTQSEIALSYGINQSHVSRIKSDKRRLNG